MNPAGPRLRILIGTWRSPGHPAAGGAELFAWEVARELTRRGHHVTISGAGAPGLPRDEVADDVVIRRRGGLYTAYPRLLWHWIVSSRYDAVIDCQSGLSMFAPIGARGRGVVLVVHHVHQEQFGWYFPAPVAAIGRWLEGPVARTIYRRTPTAAVSPSTAEELRQGLHWRSTVVVVPNGTAAPRRVMDRSAEPLVVVLGRLVRHKRVPEIVAAFDSVADLLPTARLAIVGTGDDEHRVRQAIAAARHPGQIVATGRVSDVEKDRWLSQAWLVLSASPREGWGLSLIEAAAAGVPALAVNAPGVCDAVRAGITGRLVSRVTQLGPALVEEIGRLSDPDQASAQATRCRDWAARFSWSDTARRLESLLLRPDAPDWADASGLFADDPGAIR
jgi:glycosyltransferase involved in cell wall biosynthesis